MIGAAAHKLVAYLRGDGERDTKQERARCCRPTLEALERRDQPSGFTILGVSTAGAFQGGQFSNGQMFTTSYGDWNSSPNASVNQPTPASTWKTVLSGDINGDGKTDIVAMNSAGQWWAGLNNGNNSFTPVYLGSWDPAQNWQAIQLADINGDGRMDIVGMTSGGGWWASLITGSNNSLSFQNIFLGRWNPYADWQILKAGDVNGDGRMDMIGMTAGGGWWAGIIIGSGNNLHFQNVMLGRWNPNAGWRNLRVADVNGDGQADVIGMTDGGGWWAGLSTGTGINIHFQNVFLTRWNPNAGWRNVMVGDFNGDGRMDVIGMTNGGGWWAGLSVGSGTAVSFANVYMGQWNPTAGWQHMMVADINGDGRDDIIGETSGGSWWAGLSNSTSFTNTWLGLWNASIDWQALLGGRF
jgi:hypothetical protein